jgi:hypothetical protein
VTWRQANDIANDPFTVSAMRRNPEANETARRLQ